MVDERDEQIREQVRATIKRAGVARVAKALGLSVEPTLRLAAGADVHGATIALAGQRIDGGALDMFEAAPVTATSDEKLLDRANGAAAR